MPLVNDINICEGGCGKQAAACITYIGDYKVKLGSDNLDIMIYRCELCFIKYFMETFPNLISQYQELLKLEAYVKELRIQAQAQEWMNVPENIKPFCNPDESNLD